MGPGHGEQCEAGGELEGGAGPVARGAGGGARPARAHGGLLWRAGGASKVQGERGRRLTCGVYL